MVHKIEIEDFKSWLKAEQSIMYARSMGCSERKELRVTVKGIIQVLNKEKVVWKGTSPKWAVNAYNQIRG